MNYTLVKYALLILVITASQCCCAQYADSIAAHKSHRVARALAAPSTLIAAGFAVKNWDVNIASHFRRPDNETQNPRASMHVADYSQYAPIAIAYGLSLAGNKGEHTFLKGTSLLIQSEMVMIAMVWPLKHYTGQIRPDGGTHSFPSGHTAQAFLAATFLHKEYGHKSPWYSIAGYTMASAVGMCRMISNRHWASDVLVGAGVGILSTNLVYLGHKHRKKNGQHQVTAVPSFNRGPGFYMSMKL